MIQECPSVDSADAAAGAGVAAGAGEEGVFDGCLLWRTPCGCFGSAGVGRCGGPVEVFSKLIGGTAPPGVVGSALGAGDGAGEGAGDGAGEAGVTTRAGRGAVVGGELPPAGLLAAIVRRANFCFNSSTNLY